MALYITTKEGLTPAKLLKQIKEKIDDGSITTWRYEEDNFFHTTKSDQWDEGGYLAYLRPHNDPAILDLFYRIADGTSPRKDTYGVLHGRFVEMLLNHFGKNTETLVKKL